MSQTDDLAPYETFEPREVWRHFRALNRIPRKSTYEAEARAYAERVAEESGATCQVDGRGNLVIRIAPTAGREGADGVAVQGHLDMVCKSDVSVTHDALTDQIVPRVEGDLVLAQGTTLGADNGIGVALALALLTTPGLEHGPLELILTVEEETGLKGAMELDGSLIRSTRLVNIDSDEPEVLTIGCAGGAGATLTLPVARPGRAVPAGHVGVEVGIVGLKGGHSGLQIHEPLANAIKLLTHALRTAREEEVDFALVSFNGGDARNTIPAGAKARLALSEAELVRLKSVVESVRAQLLSQWSATEPDLTLSLTEVAPPAFALADETDASLLSVLHDLPHGVIRLSESLPGTVETSTNLAQVETGEDAVRVMTSSRSLVSGGIPEVHEMIRQVLGRHGVTAEFSPGYPEWTPNIDADLLATTKAVYQEVMGHEARVQVIHAGLECGVILSRVTPGMEAISFGPRIEFLHTPQERLHISTVSPAWNLLTRLLEALAPARETVR